MSLQERRAREREERHRLIVTAARELAEAEGWEAVTTRRLSERVEYSQPVLYSHFKGKSAIVAAVAVEGFAELADELRCVRAESAERPRVSLLALANAYLDFARRRPAVYEAMFVRQIDITFGTQESPAPLKAAFGEFLAVVETIAGGRDPELLTEVVWSALHGLATLTEVDRLRPEHHRARVDLLVSQLAEVPGS
ncbi:TetR/AcrR family transcriptional regulator [Streptomyces sp. NPDC019890]|uniref:TetR/AcrR family transcriptional regulator n=1 Tax=Streptomyces sp. NPDC019890 TaxID=3365064 RepID=UPI00384DBC87